MSRAELLTSFLDGYRLRPFSWRDHNCVTFASDWITFATGRELLPDWATTSGDSARSVYRAVRRNGGTLPAAVSAQMHTEAQAAAFAQLGDVVFMPTARERGALGICSGRQSIFLTLEGGIIYHPTLQSTLSWRLPK